MGFNKMSQYNIHISEVEISKLLEESNLLAKSALEKLSEGENSAAYRCGEIIVRVPKSDRALLCYEKEENFSKILRNFDSNYFSTKIPQVEVKHKNGIDFAIHKEIKGKTFKTNAPVSNSNTHFDCLSQAQQIKLAGELGKFLAKLHSVPLDKIADGTAEHKKTNLPYKVDIKTQEKNKEFLAKHGIDYQMLTNQKDDIVLSHNDLHGGNIAINPTAETVLSGVFDLGEMGKSSRETDFMNLYAGMGRKFMRNLVKNYNANSDKPMPMAKLDHYYLNNMVMIHDYFKENNPDKLAAVNLDLANFKTDVKKEEIENHIETTRKKLKLNSSDTKKLCRGSTNQKAASHDKNNFVSYKFFKSKMNCNTP